MDMFYDVPFVYAEVNADVHSIVLSKGRVVSHSKDTERVGSFICTKAVGYPRHQNITRDYKYITSMSRKTVNPFVHVLNAAIKGFPLLFFHESSNVNTFKKVRGVGRLYVTER